MTLSPGDKLGPYEILAPLGAGGMGEVYRARDPRLNRDVAIKISRERFSDRFEREARAVAALNHPHVCTLFDIGPDYLVLEYVEGKPLRGPLPVRTALQYGVQMADALHAAHSHGVVHRDLKPANILIAKSGVKLLDFGLARLAERSVAAADQTATIAEPLTKENTILGTLQYMAPEQLEGKPADARSDIFAFGLVLYEAISGKPAFTAASQASLIAAILKEEPRRFPHTSRTCRRRSIAWCANAWRRTRMRAGNPPPTSATNCDGFPKRPPNPPLLPRPPPAAKSPRGLARRSRSPSELPAGSSGSPPARPCRRSGSRLAWVAPPPHCAHGFRRTVRCSPSSQWSTACPKSP